MKDWEMQSLKKTGPVQEKESLRKTTNCPGAATELTVRLTVKESEAERPSAAECSFFFPFLLHVRLKIM